MSIDAMAWAWEQPISNPEAKLALLAISDNADHEYRCYLTLPEINRKCGWDVSGGIRALADMGYVHIEPVYHPVTGTSCLRLELRVTE